MGALLKWCGLLLFISPLCYSANILGIAPMPFHSHQIAFAPLWRELSLKGHKVTVITTDPQNNPKLTNLTEIDAGWAYGLFGNVSKMVESSINMWNIYDAFRDAFLNVSEGHLSSEPVQNLMRPPGKFDLVIAEAFFPEFLAFGQIHNCPKIGIVSLDAPSFIHHIFGNPSHPVLNPDILTSFYGNLNFKERVISTIFEFYQLFYVRKNYYYDRRHILQKYFDMSSTVDELMSDVDMLFLNVNPIFQGVRSLGPSTVNIGGYRRDSSMKPIPKDVKDFLDGAKEGFIYFSLGSSVKSKDLKKETLTAIIETFRELPHRILWKFEAEDLPGKPDNVKLIKWAPQQSVLAHPNIKLFVTQGGLQSMEESIYSEVPLVVMPFFGDQEQNAKLMRGKGIATVVEVRPHLKKEELKTAILEVINKPNYKNAVRRLKQLALDTPMTGLEKAVWWTEYVIRNKGAKHLRNPAADIPLYQYYLLDVIGFLLFVSVLAIYIVFMSIKLLFRYISAMITSKHVTPNKKDS